MKKALAFVATFTTLISTQPVFAVDYVACREMLRTKNEMLGNVIDDEKTFWEALLKTSCPIERFTTHEKYKDYNFLMPNTNFDEMSKCREETRTNYKSSNKSFMMLGTAIPLLIDGDGGKVQYVSELYSISAIKWMKSSNKVSLDMKKAGCPYQ